MNDLTLNSKKNSLHLTAESSHSNAASICHILLENGADFNSLDSNANNGSILSILLSIKSLFFFFFCFKLVNLFNPKKTKLCILPFKTVI